jgi:2-oxoglutarate ferredoxin oxidoreductase subunit beta
VSSANVTDTALTAKDFRSNQDARWCPGCGSYSILTQMLKVLAETGARKENTVFVSGIGCSSRFPYYVDTFGFHGIHGRAPSIATGIKVANPDLNVWVMTGDGDGLSIGTNHLIHTIRKNVGLKIVLFNNRIYGLTKGQYSPTTEFGQKTKSSPWGTIEPPIHPICIAIAAEVTFIARCVDVDVQSMQYALRRAAEHKGTAFVEIYQDCAVYNHGAYEFASDRKTKFDNALYLEHGKPMIFGKNREKGIRLNGTTPEVVELGKGITADDLLIHDERATQPTLAYLLSRMHFPEFPEPLGIFREVEAPTYENLLMEQIDVATKKLGKGTLEALFNAGDTWTVN